MRDRQRPALAARRREAEARDRGPDAEVRPPSPPVLFSPLPASARPRALFSLSPYMLPYASRELIIRCAHVAGTTSSRRSTRTTRASSSCSCPVPPAPGEGRAERLELELGIGRWAGRWARRISRGGSGRGTGTGSALLCEARAGAGRSAPSFVWRAWAGSRAASRKR